MHIAAVVYMIAVQVQAARTRPDQLQHPGQAGRQLHRRPQRRCVIGRVMIYCTF